MGSASDGFEMHQGITNGGVMDYFGEGEIFQWVNYCGYNGIGFGVSRARVPLG